jgi:hypothetical protein
MAMRRGDVPVRIFQRGLLGIPLQMALGSGFLIVGLWWFGQKGMMVGMFAGAFWVFGVMIRAWARPPRCPNCSAPADLKPNAHKEFRHRFPYGWATHCPSCRMDLTRPYDGRRNRPAAVRPNR